jgi:hypothetical protein
MGTMGMIGNIKTVPIDMTFLSGCEQVLYTPQLGYRYFVHDIVVAPDTSVNISFRSDSRVDLLGVQTSGQGVGKIEQALTQDVTAFTGPIPASPTSYLAGIDLASPWVGPTRTGTNGGRLLVSTDASCKLGGWMGIREEKTAR